MSKIDAKSHPISLPWNFSIARPFEFLVIIYFLFSWLYREVIKYNRNLLFLKNCTSRLQRADVDPLGKDDKSAYCTKRFSSSLKVLTQRKIEFESCFHLAMVVAPKEFYAKFVKRCFQVAGLNYDLI